MTETIIIIQLMIIAILLSITAIKLIDIAKYLISDKEYDTKYKSFNGSIKIKPNVTYCSHKTINDEYLNSLEFNKKLDGMIISLLGKYSNKSIAKLITNELSKEDNLDANEEKKILDYVSAVLESYTNTYNSNIDKEVSNRQYNEYVDPARKANLNEVDISNSMKNFYE